MVMCTLNIVSLSNRSLKLEGAESRATKTRSSDGFIRKLTTFKSTRTDLKFAFCRFDTTKYKRDLFAKTGVELPDVLLNSVSSRQAEHLAGRLAAKLAISSLGASVNSTIPIGENGEPIWPQGVVASISHTSNLAMCCASLATRQAFVGIDIENIISSEVASDISNVVLNLKERFIVDSTNLEFEIGVTLCFSAKESLFKALYKYVKNYFDFQDAEIIAIDEGSRLIQIALVTDLTDSLLAGSKYNCFYKISNGRLITCCLDAI